MISCINFVLSIFFSKKKKKRKKKDLEKKFSLDFNFLLNVDVSKIRKVGFFSELGAVSGEQHDPHDDRHLRHGRGGFTSGERFLIIGRVGRCLQ